MHGKIVHPLLALLEECVPVDFPGEFLGLAAYLQSFLIGIPFLLFALQRYLTSSSTIELKRMSLADGIALTLASIATVAVYVVVIKSTALIPGARF